MGIGAIIGIISSVVQAVRAFSPPEPPPSQMADKLFSQLDVSGQGAIQGSDLQTAFEKIKSSATDSADKLFSKLDSDGDGRLTRSEFSSSVNQLADQLDQHYQRLRLHGEGGMPASVGGAGFTQEDLGGLVSGIANNFNKADADGNGRVSLKEARDFGQAAGGAAQMQTAAADSRNVEMMLMVVRLMQAYGVVQGTSTTTADNSAGQQVSDKV
ncbi:MAG: EF-hand domain-containing protein [Betaproteobacteria bacterium]|nr:EF-hand domain-containing protein [Betaproteobacteria bacterium]